MHENEERFKAHEDLLRSVSLLNATLESTAGRSGNLNKMCFMILQEV
jgi:hypothetical protein